MAAFDYEAINPKGDKEKGTIAAETIETARRELRNRKLAPLKQADDAIRIDNTDIDFSWKDDFLFPEILKSVAPNEFTTRLFDSFEQQELLQELWGKKILRHFLLINYDKKSYMFS